jgi:hypothetical protein
VTEVKILPAIEAHPEWRTDAKAFASGNGGVSNQGRVRSDNPAWKSHDGLFFRSQAEVNFYEACKQARLVCAPLPVFLRPGKSPPFRIEPDMIIVRDGSVVQIEIDGSEFHKESPVQAQERTRAMLTEGVRVWLIDAADCATVEKAKAALVKAFAALKLTLP